MLSIKTNVTAMEVARNLGLAYDSLGKSVNRLSSGLRIMTAADDAAGLAVRELMRANIAALSQGKRNAMDGVSMLQTAEAGVGQIDTLLIRMRELSEQAGTGTYTDAQKRIMQNEFDSLTDEINRISNQMDFNGINLLNNSDSVRISIGAGPNNRGEFIEIISQDMSAAALQVGGQKSFVENKADGSVATQDTNFIDFGATGQSISNSNGTSFVGEGLKFTFTGGTYVGFGPTVGTTQVVTVTSMTITLDNATATNPITTSASNVSYHMGTGSKSLAVVVSAINSAAAQYATATSQTQFDAWSPAKAYYNASTNRYYLDVSASVNGSWDTRGDYSGAKTFMAGSAASGVASSTDNYVVFRNDGTTSLTMAFTFGSGSYVSITHNTTTLTNTSALTTYGSFVVTVSGSASAGLVIPTGSRTATIGMGGTAASTLSIDGIASYINSAAQRFVGSATSEYTNGSNWAAASALRNSSGQYVLQVSNYYDGSAALTGGANGTNISSVAIGYGTQLGFDAAVTGFGGGSTAVGLRFAYSISATTPTSGSAMGFNDWNETLGEGITIDLVNHVCPAVTAISNAINVKDAYRAYLGYTMNRLSSVADTLDVQALQLTGAESRISDVDVATETATMTKNMVLAQAGVSMLSMANGLPQMALSLLGG